MQSQLAGVYKIGELYLLHAMEQAPPGFLGWISTESRVDENAALIDATGIARRTEVNSWFYSWASFRGPPHSQVLDPPSRPHPDRAALSEFSPEEEARFRTHLVTTGLLRS